MKPSPKVPSVEDVDLSFMHGVPAGKSGRRRGVWGAGCGAGLCYTPLACIRRCRSDVLIRKTLFRAHGFREAVGLGGLPGEEGGAKGPSCELGSRLGRKGGLSTWMGLELRIGRVCLVVGMIGRVVFASSWCGGRC